jgi:hypothetical protein
VTQALVNNVQQLHKQLLSILILFKESIKDNNNPLETREAKNNRI